VVPQTAAQHPAGERIGQGVHVQEGDDARQVRVRRDTRGLRAESVRPPARASNPSCRPDPETYANSPAPPRHPLGLFPEAAVGMGPVGLGHRMGPGALVPHREAVRTSACPTQRTATTLSILPR